MTRPLAYGKDLIALRRRGDRVGLLVVAVHDWEAGMQFAGRSEVARVVLPEDVPVAEADWSVAMALDVLVCGDSAPEVVFYDTCSALRKAGAASLWGGFEEGILLLDQLAGRSWVTGFGHPYGGPYDGPRFSAALRGYRSLMMMLRDGFYGSRIFDGARQAILQSIRGVPA